MVRHEDAQIVRAAKCVVDWVGLELRLQAMQVVKVQLGHGGVLVRRRVPPETISPEGYLRKQRALSLAPKGSQILTGRGACRYYAALMSVTLPARLDPWQAVSREAVFAGSLALVDLPRLREALISEALDAAACADFEIAFRRDEGGRAVVLGRVRATLPLQCQRCLGVVEHSVDAAMNLMLLQGPDLNADLPEPYEPLPVIDGWVVPADLIEDELLLALPQIPMHRVGACRAAELDQGPPAASAAEVEPGRRNPFAVLAGLKTES
jgi:uncharacterized protein